MTTKFNDQLHEDLFDLFILEVMEWSFNDIDNEVYFNHLRNHYQFLPVKDLFPLELAPESYERWVMQDIDWAKRLLASGYNPLLKNVESKEYGTKIKITIGAE